MRVFQFFFTVAFVGNTAFAQDVLEMDGVDVEVLTNDGDGGFDGDIWDEFDKDVDGNFSDYGGQATYTGGSSGKTWQEARDLCTAAGTTLPIPRSEAEAHALCDSAPGIIWTGIIKGEEPNTFINYLDLTPAPYLLNMKLNMELNNNREDWKCMAVFCYEDPDNRHYVNADCLNVNIPSVCENPRTSDWNQWGPWETCSVSCLSGEVGTQKRTRTCEDKTNSYGEVLPCPRSAILENDIQPCNTEICPIDKTVPDCSCPTNFKCKDTCSNTKKCEPFETTKNPNGKFNGLCVSNSFGKCRVTNDPWIHTFDGDRYFAPDWTKYLLTEYRSVSNDPVPHYKVTIRTGQYYQTGDNVNRMTGLTFSFTKPGNQEWIEMDFKFANEEIASATITIDGGNPISDVFDPIWLAGTYFSAEIVTRSRGGVDSVFICTWSNICLDLDLYWFDGTVQLPPTYAMVEPTTAPKGLCGNFNQNKRDDRKLRAQDWEVPGSRRTRRNDEESEELTNDSLDMTCPESAKYDQICENLFVSTFWDECRAVLSTEYVITICKFEYCLVPTSDVLMTILNTYARDCRSHLPRDTEAFCTYESAEWYQSMDIIPPQNAGYKKCGENMTFTGCGFQSKDMRTCEQHMLNTPSSKTELSKSGCVCKTGFVHHHNECIPTNSCPSPVGDGLGFDTDGDGVGDGLAEECTQDEFMTETALAVNGLKNLVEGFGNPILVRSLRKKWTKVNNFSFAKRNGERHGCAVAMNTPVPMSCAISGSTDVELEQAMTNFCQLFEQYVDWGIGQCEQKHARRMQKVMSMCTIAKRMIARTIAKRNKQ